MAQWRYFENGVLVKLDDAKAGSLLVKQSAYPLEAGKSYKGTLWINPPQLRNNAGMFQDQYKQYYKVYVTTRPRDGKDVPWPEVSSSKVNTTSSANMTATELDDKGYDLLKKGKYKEAALCFLQALEIEPNKATSLNGLGWCSYCMGCNAKKSNKSVGFTIECFDMAIQFFDKALKINPSYENAKKGKSMAIEEKQKLQQ